VFCGSQLGSKVASTAYEALLRLKLDRSAADAIRAEVAAARDALDLQVGGLSEEVERCASQLQALLSGEISAGGLDGGNAGAPLRQPMAYPPAERSRPASAGVARAGCRTCGVGSASGGGGLGGGGPPLRPHSAAPRLRGANRPSVPEKSRGSNYRVDSFTCAGAAAHVPTPSDCGTPAGPCDGCASRHVTACTIVPTTQANALSEDGTHAPHPPRAAVDDLSPEMGSEAEVTNAHAALAYDAPREPPQPPRPHSARAALASGAAARCGNGGGSGGGGGGGGARRRPPSARDAPQRPLRSAADERWTADSGLKVCGGAAHPSADPRIACAAQQQARAKASRLLAGGGGGVHAALPPPSYCAGIREVGFSCGVIAKRAAPAAAAATADHGALPPRAVHVVPSVERGAQPQHWSQDPS
jgi:hypothetical protein